MLELDRIYNMDCIKGMKQIEDNSIDLVIVDSPYNIGKDDWDNIKNYRSWLVTVFKECERVLKENGSFYWFHSDMYIISKLMNDIDINTNFIFKSLITWEKYQFNKQYYGRTVLMGINNKGIRNYYPMSEYILFYTFQDHTGLSKIQGSCVYPIRKYIRSEILRKKGKISFKDINKVLGTAISGGGVASACLSLNKSVPAMITKNHYNKLRAWLNKDLRNEYNYLRKEYEDLRYTFNIVEKDVTRTWIFKPAIKYNHMTPKPIALIGRILNFSSNEEDIVLDPFMGSGTTAIACKQLNRHFIGFEINPDYCDSAEKRLKNVPKKLESFINIKEGY